METGISSGLMGHLGSYTEFTWEKFFKVRETFGSFSWVRNNWQCEEKPENWKYNSADLVRLKADNTLPGTVISTLVFLLNKEGNFFDKIISLEWMCGKDFTKGKLEAATISKIWYIFHQGKYFLSEKSRGILKSDVCGNVEISTCLELEVIIILILLSSSGQYFRLMMHSHGWLWMLLTATDVLVYLSICICYANFTTLFLCCWKTSLRNKVTEPSSPHVQLQVH